VTQEIAGPDFTPGIYEQSTSAMHVTFRVEKNVTDPDNDGLAACGEDYYGTDPADPDTDDDALLDGAEIDHGTDPFDADSDGDTLLDGDEVNRGTHPLDPDTDHDGVSDPDEIRLGTNPLVADSDGDGIVDGQDPDLLANLVTALPLSAFGPPRSAAGNRTAILSRLDAAEHNIAIGDVATALGILRDLRKHLDGCGTRSDKNDWLMDCAAELTVRTYLDLIIANLL
jgi:Bacterial TSP3 repeat